MDITVIGEASIDRAPERGTLQLSVGLQSADKQRALRETTELVNRISADVDRLRALDPAPVTWSSVSALSIRSWQEHNDKGKALGLVHNVSSFMQVKFRDFTALSQFVDTWGQVVGVTTHQVAWSLTDETRVELERQVLATAVEKARARATVIANAAGLSTIVCVSAADPGLLGGGREASMEQPMAYGSMRMSRAAMMDAGGPPAIEISPEDVNTSATLHVRFQAD